MKTGRIVALEVAHFSNGGNTEDLSRGVSRISMPQGVTGRSRTCPGIVVYLEHAYIFPYPAYMSI